MMHSLFILKRNILDALAIVAVLTSFGYAQNNPFEFLGETHNQLLKGFENNLDEVEAVNLIVKNLKYNCKGWYIPDLKAEELYGCVFSRYPNFLNNRTDLYSELSLSKRQIAYLDMIFNFNDSNISITDYISYLDAVLHVVQSDDKLSASQKNIVFATLSVAKHSALFWVNRRFNAADDVEDTNLFASIKFSLHSESMNGLENIIPFFPTVDTTRRQRRLAKKIQRQTQRWIKKSARDTLWSTDSLRAPTHKWVKADAYGVLAGTLFGVGSWAALQYLLEGKDNVDAFSYSIGTLIFLAIPPINSAIYVLRYRKGKTHEQRLNRYENWNVKP